MPNGALHGTVDALQDLPLQESWLRGSESDADQLAPEHAPEGLRKEGSKPGGVSVVTVE